MPWIVLGAFALLALAFRKSEKSQAISQIQFTPEKNPPKNPVIVPKNPVIVPELSLSDLRKIAESKAQEVTSTTDIGLIVHISKSGTIGFLTYQDPTGAITADLPAIADFNRLTNARTHYVARFRRQKAGIDLVQHSLDGKLV